MTYIVQLFTGAAGSENVVNLVDLVHSANSVAEVVNLVVAVDSAIRL